MSNEVQNQNEKWSMIVKDRLLDIEAFDIHLNFGF